MTRKQPTAGADAPVSKSVVAAKAARDPETSAETLATLAGKDEATNRLLARHPNAGPELLMELSHSKDRSTRKAVCLNPNTPRDVLLDLAPQFPGDFFLNPAFDWLLLEDPEFLFKLDAGVLKNILKREDCPVSFMTWAVANGQEQQKLAVAMNPAAPAELVAKLASSRGAVGAAGKGRTRAQVDDVDLDQAYVTEVQKALSDVSLEEVKSAWKRGTVGGPQWPWLGLECRLELMGLPMIVMLCAALPLHKEAFASDPRVELRHGAARLIRDAPALLERLSQDRVILVREAVASNPSCPSALLARLLGATQPGVRAAAVRNRGVSTENLVAMAADPSSEVRFAVCGSPRTPRSVLEILARDSAAMVRKLAARRLQELADPALDPETLAEDLEAIARDARDGVKAKLAGNPSTPLHLLSEYAELGRPAIAEALCRNPAVPSALLVRAYAIRLNAIGPKVATGILSDKDCPTEIAALVAARAWRDRVLGIASRDMVAALTTVSDAELLQMSADDCSRIFASPSGCEFARRCNPSGHDVLSIPADMAPSLAGSTLRSARLLGLQHPNTPIELLIKRSKSTDWVERLALARNPTLPPNLVIKLQQDPHKIVAAQAKKTASVKSEIQARRDTILESPAEALDLAPLCSGIVARLRAGCRPWEWADTRWWGYLTPQQRNGEQEAEELLRDSPLTPDELGCSIHEWFRRAAARSESASLDLLAKLSDDPSPVVRDAARERWLKVTVESSVAELPEVLAEIARKKPWASAFVAAHPDAPSDALLTIATNADEKTLEVLCARTDLSPEASLVALKRLAASSSSDHRALVARHPDAPAGVLSMLSSDEDRRVRENVAANPRLPADSMQELRRDREESVRNALEGNPALPAALAESLHAEREAVLRKAASSKSETTRQTVASNARTPLEILIRLADDESIRVRREVAGNPSTPVEVLRSLAKDRNDWVAESALDNVSLPLEELLQLGRSRSSKVRGRVAQCRRAPAEVLARLAADASEAIREAVAGNANTSAEVLLSLASDVSYEVRCSVARRNDLPKQLFELLARDQHSAVRARLASNGSLPEVLEALLASDSSEDVRSSLAGESRSDAVLLSLASDSNGEVHRKLVENPHITTAVIDVLVDTLPANSWWITRWKLAGSRHASQASLHKLAADPRFRSQVAGNPAAGEETLRELAQDRQSASYLLGNPACPDELLDTLVDAVPATLARHHLLWHPGAGWQLLKMVSAPLWNQIARYVEHLRRDLHAGAMSREQIASHASVGLWCERLLASTALDPEAKAKSLARLWSDVKTAVAGSDVPEIASLSLDDVKTALQRLELVAGDDRKSIAAATRSTDALVRAAAALSSGIQPSLLRALLEDSDPQVRQLAAMQLRERR